MALHSIGPANRCAGFDTARSRAFITSSDPYVSRIRVSLAVAAIVITSLSIDRLPRASTGDVVLRHHRESLPGHDDGPGQHLGTHIHHAGFLTPPGIALAITVIEPAFGGALVS